MEGPRSPAELELPRVIDFLNSSLREGVSWSISAEYPTALTSSNLHNMRIITEDEKIVSHAVLKPLVVKSPTVVFKVGAIGSVVTDPGHRNQGLSTQILKDCTTQATKQQCDIAVLWTDKYDFYRRLGFELSGSEISLMIDGDFQATSATPLRFSDENKIAAEAIQRLYNQHTVGSVRSLDEIRRFLSIPQTRIYTAWEADGSLAAYAVEGKGADLGGYIHEWGGGVSKLLALVAWIKSRRQGSLTVIAPRQSWNLIQQFQQKGALINEGFLGMVKILNFDQLAAKIKRAFRSEGVSDIVFERSPNGLLFGVGSELFTLKEESDITRLIFGPVDINELDMFSETARAKLGKILPLPLWLWGWDSV
ncbi:MAG: GNAT family N-acetyltransferase [Bdellovibrionaceae bacterium]|nr:GNAT family N-acetyltransferase [Pseudobdellovibrionaceae bacterium]